MSERVRVVSHRCKSWACSVCGRILGRSLQRRLNDRLEDCRVVMVTLTINRNMFGGPFEAYEQIKRSRALPRALAAWSAFWGFDIRGRWLAKMELQEAGWPHWHVVVDLPPDAFLPIKGSFDEFWFYGFSNVRQDARASYITKYATKSSGGVVALEASGLPGRGVRWITASRGFWGVGRPRMEVSGDAEAEASEDETDIPMDPGLHAVRVLACGQASRVMRYECEEGRVRRLGIRDVGVPAEVIRGLLTIEGFEPDEDGYFVVSRAEFASVISELGIEEEVTEDVRILVQRDGGRRSSA